VELQTQLPHHTQGFRCLYAALLGVIASLASANSLAFTEHLFGYNEYRQSDAHLFGQWIQVLERHLQLDLAEGDCQQPTLNRCHMRQWLNFLDTLRDRPRAVQLEAVNHYANEKPYVLDIDNYGVVDYWAAVREFLYNNGDCEDYALTKMFSLRWLGFNIDELRLVVLQDTNLRIPHAVLAVESGDDTLILDNQIQEVVSHRTIVHYAPVYSINESSWWIHQPN